jgi:F420-non-reducing hydrogenase iron-sulfur subunit
MVDFEPKILGFLCNWCSYAGADLAGVSRMQYPTNIRVLRVMCSGRVDPVLLADSFLRGIDGILVTGCHIGDCHYISGNLHAAKRMEILIGLVDATVFKNRLRLEWVSASEGTRFAEVVRSFTEKIRALGPNPLKGNPDARGQLEAIRHTMASPRVKNVLGKYIQLTERENVYGERLPKDEMERLVREVVASEHARAFIRNLASEKPRTVPELAARMSIPPSEVLRHIAIMKKRNLVEMAGHAGQYPLFTAVKQGGKA